MLSQNSTRRVVSILGGLAGTVGSALGAPAIFFVEPQLLGPELAGPQVRDARADALFAAIEQQVFDSLPVAHQQLLMNLATCGSKPTQPLAVCFAPDTPENVVQTFQVGVAAYAPRFNLGDRWGPTAQDPGSTGTAGVPTILTYSFVPDGTFIPNGVGEGDGNSNLFTYMNGIYGSPAAWQAIYDQIFARWSQLSGIKYVREFNDDGVALVDNPGVPGVRGDLRLAGKFIDGNSGILAYNYFPQSGDMVIDTGDNFYFDTSSSSLRLRNVLAHEHGHGMGLFHVCPVDQTKLMEPFVSTNYDGIRHDDARAAQTLYGDANEPNNTAANANSVLALTNGVPVTVGTPAAPAIPFGSTVSIANSADEDWYKFTVTTNRSVSVTLRPQGLQYAESSQNGSVCTTHSASCCPSSFLNSVVQGNLSFEVRNSAGTTILGSANTASAGFDEVLNDLCLPSAGTYSIRVFATGSVPEAQSYTLTVQSDVAPIRIRPSTTVPTLLAPGGSSSFEVTITSCSEALQTGTANLRYRTSPSAGAYQTIPLVRIGVTNRYTANLPAPDCADAPQFYVEARGTSGTNTTFPANAPTGVFSAIVGTQSVAFSDNFESNLGWTVTNDSGLTDGAWERGVPVGEGGRYDPPADADGSGQCFLTGNRIGNSDVDGATTRLVSPTISGLLGAKSATVSYSRWFRGNTFDGDRFTFEVSNNNGASWTQLESVADVQAWNRASFTIPIALTNLMRFRASASDVNPQSTVEAGFDAFQITKIDCVSCPCSADFDNSGGTPDAGDVDAFFTAWLAGLASADADCSGGTPDAGDVDEFFTQWLAGGC
jgi:hypothetical protein